MTKRVAASRGDSLFAKDLLCAVSVVDRVQAVYREISVSDRPFWQIDLLPFSLTLETKNDTASEKLHSSKILQVESPLEPESSVCIIFHIRTK